MVNMKLTRNSGSGKVCDMWTLVSRKNMTFYVITKAYTVPGNQGTYDKLTPPPAPAFSLST